MKFTSKVTMPEPFTGLQLNTGWNSHEEVIRSAIGGEGVISVYTHEQAEAYANETNKLVAYEIQLPVE